MESIRAIFFDLDGTLLPMDQEEFTKGYFQELVKVLSPFGLEPKALVAAVWAGTKAMVRNDGILPNEEVFWNTFAACTGCDVAKVRPAADRFYIREFHHARAFTGENPLAVEAVRAAHAKGRRVVLASNPVFPRAGQLSRMSWVGLSAADFDAITSYETESYCKPNPAYYRTLCAACGLRPEECLMIGNDELEDAYAVTAAGLSVYLVTDCKIPSAEHPWNGPSGTFAEMTAWLKTL